MYFRKDKPFHLPLRYGLVLVLFPCLCLVLWVHHSERGSYGVGWASGSGRGRPASGRWTEGRLADMAQRRNRTMTLARRVDRGNGDGSGTLRPLGYDELEMRVRALQGRCEVDRLKWARKYGKRNIAMSRTYEGSRARLRDMVRRTILGEELILSAIGGSVTNGHQIDAGETWINVLTEWFNAFLPPPQDYLDSKRREEQERRKKGDDAQEVWRTVRASEGGWKGINGAVPATGSDYFSFCHALHVPTSSSNLILVELSVNDEYLPEHTENMENLLRGILESPNRPAVVLVQAMALSGGSMAGGGDVHMPVGVYYDVPIITQRNALAPHFMDDPDLVHPYYTTNFWQDPDTRHINPRGHRDLANLVASLVQDTACELVELEVEEEEDELRRKREKEKDRHDEDGDDDDDDDDDDDEAIYDRKNLDEERMGLILERILAEHFKTQPSVPRHDAEAFYKAPLAIEQQRQLIAEDDDFWVGQPKDVRPWGPFQRAKHAEGERERLWEGVWPGDWDHGRVPRLRFLQRWDEGTMNVPLEPQCFSTRSALYPLTPKINIGWSTWSHPDYPEKVYLKADEPGSKLTFDIETRLGTIKLYSLRSKTFGLGSLECWVDGREEQRVRADGWWDRGDLNIGRFTTIATGLPAGTHTVTCVLSSETLDPDGGTEFRLISLMSL